MLLLSGATVWLLWSAFLIFPHFRLPAAMHRAAMTLLCLELLGLLIAHYAVPGSTAADAGDAMIRDVPVLGVGLLGVAVWLLARAHRGAAAPAAEPVTTRSRSGR